MKAENEIVNEVLELYEFHKKESEKFANILGILRGTPDDNKINPPVAILVEKKTLPPPYKIKGCRTVTKKD